MKKAIKLLSTDHPLIDIIATVPISYLKKYDLPENATIPHSDKINPMYKELMEMAGTQSRPAGSAMNTLMACQQVIKKNFPFSTMFMGSIGKDKYGKLLKSKMESQGMLHTLYESDKYRTGVCAVLLSNQNRCLVPSLGAASHYPDDHCFNNWSIIESSERFYSTLYFLGTNYPTLKKVFEYASFNKKPTYLNLAAKNWVLKYKDSILDILPYTEGIIGNAEEAIALGKILGLPDNKLTTLEAVRAISLYKLENNNSKRFIVVTNSTKETLLAELKSDGDVHIISLNTPKVETHLVKSTNGAGDTLAGGMLGGLILGENLVDSLKKGQQLVTYFIQQNDGGLPEIF